MGRRKTAVPLQQARQGCGVPAGLALRHLLCEQIALLVLCGFRAHFAEREAVQAAWPQGRQAVQMRLGAVPLVLGKTIALVPRVKLYHKGISDRFCENGRCRNGGYQSIAIDNRPLLWQGQRRTCLPDYWGDGVVTVNKQGQICENVSRKSGGVAGATVGGAGEGGAALFLLVEQSGGSSLPGKAAV